MIFRKIIINFLCDLNNHYSFMDLAKLLYTKNITVFIPEHSNSSMMKNAFNEWQEKTNNQISFLFTDNEYNADINVEFTDTLDDISEHIGRTKLSMSISPDCRMVVLVNSTIIIPKYRNTDYHSINNKDTLYNVMLHEVGHSIGLKYHSRNKKSIMHAEVSEDCKITNEEIARLQKLYKFELD